jgi:hypothetical protein
VDHPGFAAFGCGLSWGRQLRLFLVGITLIVVVVAPAAPAQASHCGFVDPNCSEEPQVTNDGYVYDFDASAGVLSRARPQVGQQVVSPGDPRVWEYAYTPACGTNRPPNEDGTFPDDPSCMGAVDNSGCPPQQFAMWGYRRLVGPADLVLDERDPAAPDDTDWTRQPGVTCIGAEETWTVAELTAGAFTSLREYLEEHAQTPEAQAQPAGGSLVNLPVVVHTRQADDVELDITLPLPGVLRASPSYVWTFGPGESPGPGEQHEGPGVPYDRAISPLTSPGYYVSHAFTSTGTKTITVTNTWTATFTVAGFEIPLDELVFTDDVTVGVASARSELIAGDD